MKKFLSSICIALTLLITLCFSGCLFDPSEDYSETPSAPKQKLSLDSSSVKVIFDKIDDDFYTTKITGIVSNNTNTALSIVSIKFTIFDKDGNHIGTATDYLSELSANGTWKFSASGSTDVEPVRCRLTDLNGYDW